MNEVFNIRRFGKYFLYDLNNARGNYAVSAIVIGLLPLIALIFNVIFGLMFTGNIPVVALPMKVTLLAIAFAICILGGPVKLYGNLTERRSGSDWLMLPASSFEKFLSMAIILCIVLPLAVFGLFAICDLLLSWVFNAYGDSLIIRMANGLDAVDEMIQTAEVFEVSAAGYPVLGWLSWCASILPFGLGAICFKKGKAAKTILCLIGVEIIFSIILALIFRGGYESGYDLEMKLSQFFGEMTSEKMQTLSNVLINVSSFVLIGGLLTGLFFRVKTLKH